MISGQGSFEEWFTVFEMVGQRVPLEEKRTTLYTCRNTCCSVEKSRTPRWHTCPPCRKVGRGMVSRLGREPILFGEEGGGEGGWGGKRARNFLRERKKDAREKKTYVLVCGVRSLCRRFLNQLATWVKVRPVSLAKFFFSSESGYFVLM